MSELKQSAFVTLVGWLAILGAGFAAVAGLTQVGMLAGVTDASGLRALAVGRTVLGLAALPCAFGLLRRREWARKGMVVVLVLTLAFVAGVAIRGPGPTSVVLSVATMALLAWLAARLNATDVRAEFR